MMTTNKLSTEIKLAVRAKKLTNKAQLKTAFKMLLTTMLSAAKEECFIGDLIDSYTNLLLKEVSIRTPLK